MDKHLKTHLVITSILALVCTGLSLILAGNLSTDTTLGILPGTLSFFKDTGVNMDSYFGHSPDTISSIDLGQYGSSIGTINVLSTGNHRFTISDMLGNSFVVTIQSSYMLSSSGDTIPASAIGYTGTSRLGTGKSLTTAPIYSTDIGTSPVTFVARENNDGLSLFSQEIIIKIIVPAAQVPGSYTGMITFTY